LGQPLSIYQELKRRNVIRVGAAYVVGAWLLIQVAETIFPLFGFDDTPARFVVVILAIGFIPALVLAWVFELTPEGLKKDKEVDRTRSAVTPSDKKLDRVIIAVLALALSYFAFDRLVLAPQREVAQQERQTAELVEAHQAGRSEALAESYNDKSIAVLPFADLSPEGDQLYFSDGITEELLNLLGRLSELRVISRSSSFALRDDDLGIPEIAEKLKVAYVLEGSVRKAGKRVRVTAQLIEARSDRHLWSETYDGTLDDIFATQDQISAKVVRELQVRLLGPATVSEATDSRAYELYLRARAELAKRDHVQQAVDLFEQVIAIDPVYAPAHASLALALVWGGDQQHERSEMAAIRALKLDPGNSDALTAMGRIRVEQWREKEARELLEQAIANNPNNALAYRWLGTAYGTADPVRYEEYARKAYLTDPLDPTIHFHLAISLSRLGRFDEAFTAARELQPQDYVLAGDIWSFAGQLDKALMSYYLAYRETPTSSSGAESVPDILLSLNEVELAEAWVQDLKEASSDSFHVIEARLARFRGLPEQAVTLFFEGNPNPVARGFAQILYGPDFEEARKLFEQGLSKPGQDVVRFEPDLWPVFIHYALSLQRTGAAGHASELISEIMALIRVQLEAGVVIGPFDVHLQFNMGQLLAMSGHKQEAIEALRRAASQGGLTCIWCLRLMPHFDNLRDNVAFETLITAQEAKLATQRQRLDDEGMLLKPAQVLQLKNLSFDPFAN